MSAPWLSDDIGINLKIQNQSFTYDNKLIAAENRIDLNKKKFMIDTFNHRLSFGEPGQNVSDSTANYHSTWK